jgi:hypothetical protein
MILAMTQVRPLMTFVMQNEIRTYRLERWLAAILALLFFLPFVAQAQEHVQEVPLALVSSAHGAVPVAFTLNGTASTLAWRCHDTGIDDFAQCALLLDGKILTWRMAPQGQELTARVRFAGDLDRDGELDLLVDIARAGKNAQSEVFHRVASHSSPRMP